MLYWIMNLGFAGGGAVAVITGKLHRTSETRLVRVTT